MFQTKLQKRICTVLLIAFGLMMFMFGCNGTDSKAFQLNELLITDINNGLIASGNKSGYKTYTVKTGDITTSIQYKATANVPHIEDIMLPYTEGKITYVTEYLGSSSSSFGNYDTLEEGDPIARFLLHLDSTELQEIKIALEEAEVSYQTALTEKESELEALKALVNTATSITEGLLYEHDYQNALSEYNEYIASQEALISSLKKKYDLYSQGSIEFDVCAPSHGLVIFPLLKKGQLIDPNEPIGSLYIMDNITFKIENQLFAFEGQAPIFNYGDKINIATLWGREEIFYPGTVISAPNILYDTSIIYVTIAFNDIDAALEAIGAHNLIGDMTVQGTYNIAEDVLIIPPDALEVLTDTTGIVTMYDNGNIYTVNVTYAYKDAENVWITSGLKEGDVIVINQ